MKYFFAFSLLFVSLQSGAQYAPQAGLPGSTAISASDNRFVEWAKQCVVQRGYMNIADPSLGYASAGVDSFAAGPADGYIVSLGDSGVADVTFAHPVIDGPGADFAVFENGFRDPADSSRAFLELAFVEVSSDGINYYRFPASSLTQTTTQIGNGNYADASLLNNLAGKYVANYGTPFDLHELSGIAALDMNNITHVRITDVVGSVSGYSSLDSAGRIINDPYPTPFASCGFDLDAVGVINESPNAAVISVADNISVNVYPIPAFDNIYITLKGGMPAGLSASVTTVAGNVVQQFSLAQTINTVPVANYPAGLYYLVLRDANGNQWVEKIIKR
jgi:hypothetical protein